jgi:hypothetical protein
VSVTVTVPEVTAVPTFVAVIVYEPVPPAVKLPVCDFVIVKSGAETEVGSEALSLAVFTSPPPATVAIFVTLAGAFAATDTVSVRAG